MINKFFGDYPSAILLLLIGLALSGFGITTEAGIVFKIGATMLGAILTLVNGLKLVWLTFFDGKEDDAKLVVAYPYAKKYQAVNMERWITPMALVGLALATGLIFMAFTIEEKPKEIISWGHWCPDIADLEEPPPTDHPKPPPPPPPPPPAPPIDIVEDNVEVTDEPEIVDAALDDNEEIPIPEIDVDKESEEFENELNKETENMEPEVVDGEPEIYGRFDVQEKPSFIGGEKKLMEYLYSNIKYPAIAKENDIQGTVYVQFIIDENGNITNVTLPRDIGGGCGDEALRVISSMPKWNPGFQHGKPVKVRFGVPVRFKLQ